MFSTKLTRVAHRATSVAAKSTPSSTAASRSTSCLASSRSHQRRHSSSKASCPPENSASGGKPAPTTKAADATDDKLPAAAPAPHQRGGPKRVSRTKKSKSPSAVKPEDQFAGLPAVAGTQHLSHENLSVSSFFSLHRPLSIATAIPPPSSAEVFDNIFESRKEVDPWENGNSAEGRPEDVVYALRDLFEGFDNGAQDFQDEGMRWEVIQESPSNQDGVQHLDGPPRLKKFEDRVAEFKPYRPPPPPQPFLEEAKGAEMKKRVSKPKQKSYEAKIIVNEFTNADGQRTYNVTASPIVRIHDTEEHTDLAEPYPRDNQVRWPHRERMFERQRAFQLRRKDKTQRKANAPRTYVRKAPSPRRVRMLLISVKRQRKLKMKKHKYKKLMKRTRNLRRRQDRA